MQNIVIIHLKPQSNANQRWEINMFQWVGREMYLPVPCALFLTNAQTIHNALTLKEYEVRPVKYELMRTQNEMLEVITAINKQLGSVCRSRFPERTWSDHNFDKVISDLWSWPPSHSWGWNAPTCSSLIFYVCTKQLYGIMYLHQTCNQTKRSYPNKYLGRGKFGWWTTELWTRWAVPGWVFESAWRKSWAAAGKCDDK